MLKIIQFCISIFCFAVAAAQDNDVYTSYGINEGLPQSSVWSIVQDKNGFLWAGTADGACRFDGYNFKVYRNNPKDPHSILGGLYVRFYVDSSKTLWAISPTGICVYNEVADDFTTLYTHADGYTKASFNCIFGEDEQYLWACISTKGLLKIDKKTRKVLVVKNTEYSHTSTFTAWQNGFVKDGKVWISGVDAFCYVYDIKKEQLTKLPIKRVSSVVNFNDSEVVGTSSTAPIIINKYDLSFREVAATYSLSLTDLKTVTLSSDSEMVFGGAQGIVFIDPRTWTLKKRVTSFEKNQERSFANVQCLFRDRSGNLWVGTNGDGLKMLPAKYKKFKHYCTHNNISNLVKSIYADTRHVYAGYFGNGVDVFDREKGFTKNLVFHMGGKTFAHIYGIAGVDSNTLLVTVGSNSNIHAYKLKEDKVIDLAQVFRSVLPEFPTLQNNDPFIFSDGRTVCTNAKDHLLVIDISSKSIKPVAAYKFKDETLTCAYVDDKDRIYIGSINGAWLIDGGRIIKIALPEVVHVKGFCHDMKGNIWIATINGIYVVDGKGKVIKKYDENNGLANRFTYGILRDGNGNMWFSHNKGISVYRTATGTFRHYTAEDGLQSNEFNTGAYFKAADGTLFFGGINGTNGFRPEEIKDNPHVPVIKITDIKLFDRPLKTDSAYWYERYISLPYDSNSISFEFTGIEFTNPRQNRYKYMMEGLDNDWIDAGDRRFARYAAIPPGTYTFKVKASNNDGVWQNEPAAIVINIIPPYWQQLWFRILMIIVFGGAIAAIIVAMQRQRYKRRLRAIELQNRIQMERERISRDLHDNVGTQLSLISNNIDWVQHPLKAMTETEKTDKLKFVSDVAKDIIATLRETIWALNKEQISLEEFSDKLKVYVHKQVSLYPLIELVVNEEIDGSVILGPSEALNLFRMAQEAVANSLKYAEAKNINIEIQGKSGGYQIAIKDDGKGFAIENVDPAVQNGLENMRYRADDIGAVLKISSAIGHGTTISIAKK